MGVFLKVVPRFRNLVWGPKKQRYGDLLPTFLKLQVETFEGYWEIFEGEFTDTYANND